MGRVNQWVCKKYHKMVNVRGRQWESLWIQNMHLSLSPLLEFNKEVDLEDLTGLHQEPHWEHIMELR